jgi:hypothetical protein
MNLKVTNRSLLHFVASKNASPSRIDLRATPCLVRHRVIFRLSAQIRSPRKLRGDRGEGLNAYHVWLSEVTLIFFLVSQNNIVEDTSKVGFE